jgi:hypothetical protein
MERIHYKKLINFWALVAHACNPSYSRGRDQEACGSKTAQADSLRDPVLGKKKNHKKRAGGVAQGVGPELRPHYHKTKPDKLIGGVVGRRIVSLRPAWVKLAGPCLKSKKGWCHSSSGGPEFSTTKKPENMFRREELGMMVHTCNPSTWEDC